MEDGESRIDRKSILYPRSSILSVFRAHFLDGQRAICYRVKELTKSDAQDKRDLNARV
jgi:hypothetical protein